LFLGSEREKIAYQTHFGMALSQFLVDVVHECINFLHVLTLPCIVLQAKGDTRVCRSLLAPLTAMLTFSKVAWLTIGV
jgi:hypothetical protein